MFLFKKIVSAFLLPIPIGLFLLFLAFVFLLSNSYKKAKLFLFFGLSWFLVLSFQPVANAIIKPLENSHKALIDIPKVDYILVLGNGHKTDESLSITSQVNSIAINRLSEGLRIYNALDKKAKLIVSGYSGGDVNSHASMQKKLAISLGVNEDNIIALEKPKDTRQEALEVKKLVKNKKFILVTSAAHMKRSMLLFKYEGLDPIAAPTNHLAKTSNGFSSYFSSSNIRKVESAVHEYLGILWAMIRNFI